MRILLDENIDVRFKFRLIDNLPEHTYFTIRDMGWNGMKNGQLINEISVHKFDVFIAVDKNIPFQQNIEKLSFLIIILDVKRNILSELIKCISEIENILSMKKATGIKFIRH